MSIGSSNVHEHGDLSANVCSWEGCDGQVSGLIVEWKELSYGGWDIHIGLACQRHRDKNFGVYSRHDSRGWAFLNFTSFRDKP
jgi:hypothetical protein